MFGQQYYPQQPFVQYQAQQQGAFQEVEGPESIQMLRLMPNSKSVFFDRHMDRFYAVSTDAAGTKAVEAFDFVRAQEPSEPQYLTVDEFNAWRSQYEQSVQQPQPATIANSTAGKPARKSAGGGA